MATQKLPPYVNAYGILGKFLEKIQTASVPTKVTRDFLSTVLGLKSSSYQAMIPLLKRLGFLDPNSTPTQRYKDFRSTSKSGFVMAKALQEGYADLYKGNEYAEKLDKNELLDLVATVTGASKEDKTLGCVVGTFSELKKFATFDVAEIPEDIGDEETEDATEDVEEKEENSGVGISTKKTKVNFGISYTINLNLPASTEVKVFDAIFKSLKKNLLDDHSIE